MTTEESQFEAEISVVDWSEEQARGDDMVAKMALRQYPLSDQVQHRMITLSENATYLVQDPGTEWSGILRVHRENYHDRQAIESELDWLEALARDTDVTTSHPVRTKTGERVVTVEHGGVERYAVMFELMPGIHPDATVIRSKSFETLGAITAHLHQQAKHWVPPASFKRFAWDWQHTLGESPRWGRWQDGAVQKEDIEEFSVAVEEMRQRLEAYGTGAERFGLIHADLRLANLLVEGDHVSLIDFDDCGFGWFMYDFGAAVSFMEDHERLLEFQWAWVSGYRSVAELPEEDLAMLPTFVLLRRFMLTAWLGSHGHSEEMRDMGERFVNGTRRLTKAYLANNGTSFE